MGNVIKSFKKMKNKSFRKTAFVKIDDEYSLPLKTLSAMENSIDIDLGIEKPIIERKMNQQEIDEYLKTNTKVNKAMVKNYYVAEYDLTDSDYLKSLKEQESMKRLLSACKYVDLKYKINKRTQLWQDLDLESENDYIGLVKKLFDNEENGGFDLGEVFLSKMLISIRSLENDPILMKLAKLQEMYDEKNEFEMLDDLLSLEKTKEQIKELNLELNELKNKMSDINEQQ